MVRITSKTEEKKPSFYKIVFYCYNTEELCIPPNVGKHMLEELTHRASLKLEDSSDCSWTVKVHSVTTGGVYFKDGWPEFLKDNSLGNGENLVFSYDGRMHFSITVFKKACKRVDPTNIGSNQNPTYASTSKRLRGRPRKYPPVSSSKHPLRSSSSSDNSGENLLSTEGSEFKKFTDKEEDCGDNAFQNSEASCEVISSESLSLHSSQSVL